MSEPANDATRPVGQAGRVLFHLTRILAIFGGFLCAFMAALITVSVTGRYLFAAPIPGDYDLVGILSGCAAFAFLPYCQMTRGNVVVDFFTTSMHPRGRAALDGMGSLFYLVVAGLFTWRLYYGAIELRESAQVLAALNFYRWWTLPFDILCMVMLVATIVYTLRRDAAEASRGSA